MSAWIILADPQRFLSRLARQRIIAHLQSNLALEEMIVAPGTIQRQGAVNHLQSRGELAVVGQSIGMPIENGVVGTESFFGGHIVFEGVRTPLQDHQ